MTLTLPPGESLSLGNDLSVVHRELTGRDFFTYLKISDVATQVRWLAINFFEKANGDRLTVEDYEQMPMEDAVTLNTIANGVFNQFSAYDVDAPDLSVSLPGGLEATKRALKGRDYIQFVAASAASPTAGLEWVICNAFLLDGDLPQRDFLEALPMHDLMALCGLAQNLFMTYQGGRI